MAASSCFLPVRVELGRLCSQAQVGVAGQALAALWLLCARSPAYLAQARVISTPFFPSHPTRSMPWILFSLQYLLSWVSLLGRANMQCCTLLLSSQFFSFSPVNVIVIHLVKATEGMRRGQTSQQVPWVLTAPVQAQWHRHGGQYAQLHPLPPLST